MGGGSILQLGSVVLLSATSLSFLGQAGYPKRVVLRHSNLQRARVVMLCHSSPSDSLGGGVGGLMVQLSLQESTMGLAQRWADR